MWFAQLRKEVERLQQPHVTSGPGDGVARSALAAEVAELRAANEQLREELAVFGEPEFLAGIESDQRRVAELEEELRTLAREHNVPVSVV